MTNTEKKIIETLDKFGNRITTTVDKVNERISMTVDEFGKKVNTGLEQSWNKFDNTVQKYRVRRLFLILLIFFSSTGIISGAIGTFSQEYKIQKVTFTNKTFYQKALLYGETYQPLGVSLVPEINKIYTISAYVLTPTDFPSGFKFPTIIWCHGMTANAELQLHYAMEMCRAGFKVIAINLDGHGDSGGGWSLGLTNLQTFYAAVEYATTLQDVNVSAIGVSGHSNGGYGATRAGLFDKSPLGTGGLIKTVGAIWCLSDFNQTMHEMVSYGNVVNNTDYFWLIPMFIGLNSNQITEKDMLQRAISPYANETNIPNWYLVCGSEDEMASPSVIYNSMASAVESYATVDQLKTTVESYFTTSDYGWWNNTNYSNVSFTNGTARKVAIRNGLGHIDEAIDPKIIQELIDWFRLSFGLDPTQYASRVDLGINVRMWWILRYVGMVFTLVAMFTSQFYLIVILASKFFPERISYPPDINHPQHQNSTLNDKMRSSPKELILLFINNWKRKIKFFIGLTLCISGGVALFYLVKPQPISQVWIFNAHLLQFLFMSIFVWIYALFIFYIYQKSRYYGPHVDIRRFGITFKGFAKGFLFSFIIVFGPVTIYNILATILTFPRIFPRPAETGIWLNVLYGTLILWLFYLPFEIMVKTQLFTIRRKYDNKSTYWLEIIANSLFVFFIWMIGCLFGGLFMGPTLLGMVFFSYGFGHWIFMFSNSLMFIINGFLAYITGLIYQRTRNIFACSFFAVFFISLLLFGKAFGIYTLF